MSVLLGDLSHLLASLPLLSSVVYRDPFLNSCPPGLALAPAPGLQSGRHPDRLQMSVGVGLRQALVLRVWRRRINGLYLRASLPAPSRSEEREGRTSCSLPLSPTLTQQTHRAERGEAPLLNLRTSKRILPFSKQAPLIYSRKFVENLNLEDTTGIGFMNLRLKIFLQGGESRGKRWKVVRERGVRGSQGNTGTPLVLLKNF